MRQSKVKTYKIGQTAKILQVETYVLRFWESEFPQLSPIRTSKGQRLYTQEDLDLLRKIKYLLYDQGLTIQGAKKKLAEQTNWSRLLEELKQDILEIKEILSS